MFSKEQTDCHAIARNDDRIKRLTTPNPRQLRIPEMRLRILLLQNILAEEIAANLAVASTNFKTIKGFRRC